MNIPMSWLKQYVDIDCGVKEYMDAITMTGTKVEALALPGAELKGIVTGKITSVGKHPNADKLSVCRVDIGVKQLQIVTGAANIFAGAVVSVAIDGAVVYNGHHADHSMAKQLVTISTGQLRGELSEGMLCSIEELGHSKQEFPEAPDDGIYIFQEAVEIGANACELLGIVDEVVEYELTSNRPDCYSVIGIAKEAAATFGQKLNFCYDINLKEEGKGKAADYISVEIQNPELCPRYIGRVVTDVKIEPSPQWMRNRLIMSGLRPINNIVDITNYVMLELGQPMHAFDIDDIANKKIIVRNADDGENFVTLDGAERTLDASMLVISDPDKAIAVAGVMGGENSKATESAAAILFESANFNGINIRLTAKKLGMRTDASSKFEKGLDPNLALLAVNRAMSLVEELGCGKVVPGMVDCYPNKRESWNVVFSPSRINKLLGTEISTSDMCEYLSRLGVKTIITDDIVTAEIPTCRPDLTIEADIAEEVARLYGYDHIGSSVVYGIGRESREQILENELKNTLIGAGFCESLTYSFESPKIHEKLNLPADSPLRNAVKIINPLGEDYSIMRTAMLGGMLNSLAHNNNKRNDEAFLFEMGRVFLPKSLPISELPIEQRTLMISCYGGKDIDFYFIKGIIEMLGDKFAVQFDYCKEAVESMHPGRVAAVYANGIKIGYAGEVSPVVTNAFEINKRVYATSINLDELFKIAVIDKNFKPIPKYPAITRDLALIVGEDVFSGDLAKAIKETGGTTLEGVTLFDVYNGEQVEKGFKSLAFSLVFRLDDRTLTDDEIVKLVDKILLELSLKYNAKLRV